MKNTKYVEALMRIAIEIDADNPRIEDYHELIVNLPTQDFIFPLIDDGRNIKGKIVEYETMSVVTIP